MRLSFRASWSLCASGLLLAVGATLVAKRDAARPSGRVDVLSYRNDLASSGLNLHETILTPANVTVRTFGRLFTSPVDGQVFVQPLVKTQVRTAGGVRDLVYVATEHDSVYAFDAQTGVLVWRRNFTDAASGVTPVPARDVEFDHNIYPEIGITGTPVIDPGSSTLYVSAATKEVHGGDDHYVQRLHALDLATGQERPGSPATIGDTIHGGGYRYVSGPAVNGVGDGSRNGRLTFNAMREDQRPALTLVNGIVYIAWASHNDIGPYHGWILGYRASDLKLVAAFNDSPNGGLAGIWMGAGKIAADDRGFLYVSTGNGTFDPRLDVQGFPSGGDYGNAFLKLAPDPQSSPDHPNVNGWGLKVADYFVPGNYDDLNRTDADIGGGGVIPLPDGVGGGGHARLLVGGGKDCRILLVDRDRMGKYDPAADHAVQAVDGALNRIFDSPLVWNGRLYFAADGDRLKAFPIAQGRIGAHPAMQSQETFGFPGASPALSADGAKNAILWCLNRGENALCAYDPGKLDRPLYTSSQAAGGADHPGNVVRFTVPAIANGEVFVGTNEALVAYGLRKSGAASPGDNSPAPILLAPKTPSGAQATPSPGAVALVWRDNSDNETGFNIYRKEGTGGEYRLIASLPANATQYTDRTDVRPKTQYNYHIVAVNAVGNSDFAGVTVTTP
jgi:hypothetical protein